jgi:hypothetical protein
MTYTIASTIVVDLKGQFWIWFWMEDKDGNRNQCQYAGPYEDVEAAVAKRQYIEDAISDGLMKQEAA